MDYEQHLGEDYGAGSSAVAGVELERIIAGGNHEVQGPPGAANANRRGRGRGRGGRRRPSCPRGGILRPANGAAWEVSRRYGASNVDGMDNEAEEADLQEEDFSPRNYAPQPTQDIDRMQPEPENPALPTLASHFISTICTTSRDITATPTASTVQELLDMLQGKTLLLSGEKVMANDSLASLAGRCALADQAAQAADLVYMLSCIALRAKVIRCVFVLFRQMSIYSLFLPVFPGRLLLRKPPFSKGSNGLQNTGRRLGDTYLMERNTLFSLALVSK